MFFAFFGFADEAKKHYRSAVESVAKKVGYTSFSLTSSHSTGATDSATFAHGSKGFTGSGTGNSKARPVPPVFVHSDLLSRHRSIDSFTNVSISFNDAGGLLSDDEKKDTFSPDTTMGTMTIDGNGTLADYNNEKVSPTPSSGSSEAPSSPSISRQPSVQELPRHESDRSAV